MLMVEPAAVTTSKARLLADGVVAEAFSARADCSPRPAHLSSTPVLFPRPFCSAFAGPTATRQLGFTTTLTPSLALEAGAAITTAENPMASEMNVERIAMRMSR